MFHYFYIVIQSISIQELLADPKPLIDVRSPGEFEQGHIPGAVNVPLFSDDERAHIGTVYVRRSRDEAMQIGYAYANPKKQWFIDEVRNVAPDGSVVIHCWRGGMRSRLFAEHLHENGFENISVITGGYKSWRRLLNEHWSKPHQVLILGGYTGSGKTPIVKKLQELGHQAIDLEGLACHKGSAFGAIGQKPQPTTEQFENNLYDIWSRFNPALPVWLEDESCNIGKVNLPAALFTQMRAAPVFFLDIPRSVRAEYLVTDYAAASIDDLKESILKISRRLGGQNVNQALQWLDEGNLYEVAFLSLSYYDKAYSRGLEFHDNKKVLMIAAESINTEKNTELILDEYERGK
ncbi:MAG TPA: tRNA 2-selenouridine(34) synthase MnmH [Bacteroidales bacterium]|nr:tRNA 2-selenouridine(34) synthase MnmH [Bacteroidales bacterium]HCB60420.1 tRNA 2-selenouridine(34) synthase MnmH [Bacteroidales bacterium]HCY23593.1 tRNA 2-selenouridine(34) synthase MnmH [Bacteroidales bacterium]